MQGDEYDERMTIAIQHAYYLKARNPSDTDTLLDLADEIGLDGNKFSQDLLSERVQQQLLSEIDMSRTLNVSGFPALVLQVNHSKWSIPVNYNNSEEILEQIISVLNQI